MAFAISDLVVDTLELAGVRRAYGLPRDSLNGLTDALRRNGRLAWEHIRHEEEAAFAAAADAAITGEPAVCAASCGPGNLHLINGLFDAHRSRLPVLAITAHIPSREIGRSCFTLYATRSVLSRRGAEVIDLARTNVTRRLFS